MKPEGFKIRAKALALRAITTVDALPPARSGDVLGRQPLRSAAAVASNYRAACRARSTAEFIAELGIVEEKAGESEGWIDWIADAGLVKRERVEDPVQEAGELAAMTVSSIRTARRN